MHQSSSRLEGWMQTDERGKQVDERRNVAENSQKSKVTQVNIVAEYFLKIFQQSPNIEKLWILMYRTLNNITLKRQGRKKKQIGLPGRKK